PLADQFDEMFAGNLLHGYEDFICLAVLFCVTLGLLRLLSNMTLPTQVEVTPRLQQLGSILVGLLAGYLAAGFLICVLQTLPWHERFMHFDPRIDPEAPTQKVRLWLPPDRVWLAMMHKA